MEGLLRTKYSNYFIFEKGYQTYTSFVKEKEFTIY